MKHLIFLVPALLASLTLEAQEQQALDAMTGRLQQFHAIEMRFTATTLSVMPDAMPDTARWSDVVRGRLTVMGSRFRLQLPRMQVWSDGQKTYQYVPEYKEINVTPHDDGGEFSLTSRPDLLLTACSRYFKAQPLQKASAGGLKAYRLTPMDAAASPYRSLQLWVSAASLLPVMLAVEDTSGGITAVALHAVTDNRQIQEKSFTLDMKDFPKDTELIDLTF